MPQLTIRTLGPPELALDGAPLDTSRHKAIALLIYLAVTGERHRRDALATLFWPDYEQAKSYAYLRRTLWEIKDALGEGWLEADRESVGLAQVGAWWLDVAAFRQALAATATHGHAPAAVCPACIEPLGRVAELYRGDFLAGFSLRDSVGFDDWQFFLAEGLRQEAGDALRKLSAIHERQRQFDAAIAAARRWLALDPLNEEAHRQLMLLYALNGQRSAALRQFQECQRLLQNEMEVAPERKTGDLLRRIERGEIAGPGAGGGPIPVAPEPAEMAAPAAGQQRAAPCQNLPQLLTPFIGRERELNELDALLSDPEVRLLTVLGVGGMGKTRLAIEAATCLAGRYPHGASFLYLAPLPSVSAIYPALADALCLDTQEGVTPERHVLDFLREKRWLLVLDNFEHLLNEAEGAQGSDLVTQILSAAPGVQVLVTSRLPLNLQGEHRYHLAGMDYPAGEPGEEIVDYGAVKLFVQGARRAQPGFKLQEEDWRHVAAICRLVQGMPLGILLAAGWAELLPLPEIAHRIAQGLDFLETDLRDVPERQRNMRALLDQAWRLLGEEERRSFMRLAVFRGSFDRPAAQAVSGASLRVLISLVNKSLLTRLPDDRLVVHELLRQYAAEQLAADSEAFDDAHDRHSALYCARLREWAQALKNPRRARDLPDIEREAEDVRTAWSWAAIQRRVDHLAAAAEGLGLLLSWQNPDEAGDRLFELAADALDPPESERERVLLGYLLAWQTGFTGVRARTPSQTQAVLARGLTLLSGVTSPSREHGKALAFAHFIRGTTALGALDHRAAEEALEHSLALFEQADEQWWMALVLERLGHAAWVPNDLERTQDFFQRSLALRQALGDRIGTASLLNNLGGLLGFDLGRVDEAEQAYLESSRLFAELGGQTGMFSALLGRQAVARLRGRFAEAQQIIGQQMALLHEWGDRDRIAEIRLVQGEVYQHMGQYRLAEAEHRKNMAYYDESGWKGPETWERWALGAALLATGDWEEAAQVLRPNLPILEQSDSRSLLGRSLAALSRAELALGEPEAAWTHVIRAIELLVNRHYFWLLEAMAAAATVLAARGQVVAAVEINALLNRHPFVANSRWFADVFGLPPETVSAATIRGQALDLTQAAEALLPGTAAREFEKRF